MTSPLDAEDPEAVIELAIKLLRASKDLEGSGIAKDKIQAQIDALDWVVGMQETGSLSLATDAAVDQIEEAISRRSL